VPDIQSKIKRDNERPKILLGLTGGVAAYKAAELVRRLGERGIGVHVVMTKAACGFITPATLQALSGNPVYTDMWDGRIANGMPHIELSRDKQAIVVAPATADFLAKTVYGLADDLLSTLCLARDCPLIVAPAMNRQMWEHPATQRNISQLSTTASPFSARTAGIRPAVKPAWGACLRLTNSPKPSVHSLRPKYCRANAC